VLHTLTQTSRPGIERGQGGAGTKEKGRGHHSYGHVVETVTEGVLRIAGEVQEVHHPQEKRSAINITILRPYKS